MGHETRHRGPDEGAGRGRPRPLRVRKRTGDHLSKGRPCNFSSSLFRSRRRRGLKTLKLKGHRDWLGPVSDPSRREKGPRSGQESRFLKEVEVVWGGRYEGPGPVQDQYTKKKENGSGSIGIPSPGNKRVLHNRYDVLVALTSTLSYLYPSNPINSFLKDRYSCQVFQSRFPWNRRLLFRSVSPVDRKLDKEGLWGGGIGITGSIRRKRKKGGPVRAGKTTPSWGPSFPLARTPTVPETRDPSVHAPDGRNRLVRVPSPDPPLRPLFRVCFPPPTP